MQHCNTCFPVHYISMIYFIYNWKFVPFDPLYLFLPLLHSTSGSYQSVVLCIYEPVFVFCFFSYINQNNISQHIEGQSRYEKWTVLLSQNLQSSAEL